LPGKTQNEKEVFEMNNVKLIGVTQPTINVTNSTFEQYEPSQKMTAEQLIAYCARVSNPANQDNPDAERLLKYLVKNKHWSPFEMVHVIMEISTTRDIGRQILRHRSFSFQEFSQRYAEVGTPLNAMQGREPRLQDVKNRQNSIEGVDSELESEWYDKLTEVMDVSYANYKWAIDNGIAKEQARVFLPEGLTKSRMYMSGSLRSWIHYIEIRTDPSTQKEHRLIAEQAKQIILEQFPSLKDVLDNNNQ
jgi:thymidylate synthase (FAD)